MADGQLFQLPLYPGLFDFQLTTSLLSHFLRMGASYASEAIRNVFRFQVLVNLLQPGL